jgi:chromosome segregation ATPase
LNFVDLAGSESQKKADTSNRGFEEAIKINLSNYYLGQTISALSKKMRPSYRSTKLTHVLQYALGGNGKTLFITNITPSSHLYSETLNSLTYANKAQKIEKIQAKINVQNNALDTVMKQKEQEIQSLKKTVEEQAKEISRLNDMLNKNSRKRQNQKIDNENDPNDDFISTDSENEKSEANASNIKKRLAKLNRKLHLKKSILTQKEGQKEDILNLIGDEIENPEKIFEHYLTNCDPMPQESSFTEQEKNENEAIKNYENEILILKAEKENMEKEIYELKLNAKNDTLLSKEINELKIPNKLKEENELLNEEIKDLKTENKKLSKENEKLLKKNEEFKNKLSELYGDETELKDMARQTVMKVRRDLHKSPSKTCSIM